MGDEARALTRLLPQVRELVRSARHTAARAVNTLQVATNFEIGRLIVQHQEHGPQRADYGVALLKQLSMSLTEEFGRGFSRSNLEYMRRFYALYRDRAVEKSQTLSGISQRPDATPVPPPAQKSQTLSGISQRPFALSWSHYVFLIRISNPEERAFYELEG